MDILKRLIDYRNIHLAYERVKNSQMNRELFNRYEKEAFEHCIPKIYDEIIEILKSPRAFTYKRDILFKPKKFTDNKGWEKRPLTRINFYDSVIIQSVMNVIAEMIKPLLPSDNYGNRLSSKRSLYMYEPWRISYSNFVKKEIKAASNNYSYVLEIDIENFYGSIRHNMLKQEIKDYICTENSENSDILYKWLDKILCIYDESNLNEPRGLPQGGIHSPLLASFYIRDILKSLRENLRERIPNLLCFGYVDDFRFYFEIEEHSKLIKQEFESILEKRNMKFNLDKSKISEISGGDKLKETKVMERASNLNRAIVDSIIVTSNSRKRMKENLLDLMAQVEELFEDNIEKKAIFTERISKFVDYRIVKILDSYEEWNVELSKFDDNDGEVRRDRILNFSAILHALFISADTVMNKRRLLKLLNKIISNKDYSELTYVKYVSLSYYFRWSHNELRLTDKEINNWVGLKSNGLIKEIKENCYYIKAILANCHFDWYNIIKKSNIINSGIINKSNDIELKTILFSTLGFKEPKVYEHNRVNLKIEQAINESNSQINLKYKTYISDTYRKSISDYYLSDSVWKKVTYIKFACKNNNTWQCSVSNKVSFKEISQRLSENEKMRLLRELFNWLDVQVNSYKSIIPLSVINPEYIWVDESITEIVLLGNPAYKNQTFYYCLPDIVWKEEFANLFSTCFGLKIETEKSEITATIEYWKLRIIELLKGKYGKKSFDYKLFIEYVLNILNTIDTTSKNYADGGHFNLSHLTYHYIHDAKLHDSLLSIASYVESSWENGSKECYFYTLHNHKHARLLINRIHELIEQSAFRLYINSKEAFRLFAACFIHDLGMLSGPTADELYNEENDSVKKKGRIDYYLKTIVPIYQSLFDFINEYISKNYSNESEVDIAATGFINSNSSNSEIYKIFSNIQKSTLKSISESEERPYKNVLLKKANDLHLLTEGLREEIVRENHSKVSKDELIKYYQRLPLSIAERRDISIICASHGQEVEDVNQIPDNIEDGRTKIRLKFISHLLRLADLCDVESTRVSKEVLERNVDRMSKTSKFHWVKHLSVDVIDISNEKQSKNESQDIINNTQKVTITISHNYLPNINCSENILKCNKNIEKCIKLENPKIRSLLNDDEKLQFTIDNFCQGISQLFESRCSLECAFNVEAYFGFIYEVIYINKYFIENNIDVVLDLVIKKANNFRYDFKFAKDRYSELWAQEFMINYLASNNE